MCPRRRVRTPDASFLLRTLAGRRIGEGGKKTIVRAGRSMAGGTGIRREWIEKSISIRVGWLRSARDGVIRSAEASGRVVPCRVASGRVKSCYLATRTVTAQSHRVESRRSPRHVGPLAHPPAGDRLPGALPLDGSRPRGISTRIVVNSRRSITRSHTQQQLRPGTGFCTSAVRASDSWSNFAFIRGGYKNLMDMSTLFCTMSYVHKRAVAICLYVGYSITPKWKCRYPKTTVWTKKVNRIFSI